MFPIIHNTFSLPQHVSLLVEPFLLSVFYCCVKKNYIYTTHIDICIVLLHTFSLPRSNCKTSQHSTTRQHCRSERCGPCCVLRNLWTTRRAHPNFGVVGVVDGLPNSVASCRRSRCCRRRFAATALDRFVNRLPGLDKGA